MRGDRGFKKVELLKDLQLRATQALDHLCVPLLG
jgi:hypothetical protein